MHFWLCTTWSWKSLNLSHIYLKSYILYYLNCRCKSMYIAQNEQLWDQTTFAFILKSKYNFEVHLFNFCKTFCTFTCRDPNEQNQDFLLKLTDNGTEIHTRKTNLQVLFSNIQYHQASSLMQLFHTLSKKWPVDSKSVHYDVTHKLLSEIYTHCKSFAALPPIKARSCNINSSSRWPYSLSRMSPCLALDLWSP